MLKLQVMPGSQAVLGKADSISLLLVLSGSGSIVIRVVIRNKRETQRDRVPNSFILRG